MIVDGQALALEVLARAQARAAALGRTPEVIAIVANETSATKSYLSIKEKRAADAGCVLRMKRFDTDVSAERFEQAVSAASNEADAVVVQLPLPEGIDARAVCDLIPFDKDADVLSSAARMRFEADEPGALIPPVASALAKILAAGDIDPRGKKAVVLGMGWLVGRPCATWLAHAGADVSHVTDEFGNIAMLSEADIIVSGVGSPHFIQPEMLKEGVVLIDAGTSESNGKVAGDADPACEAKCSLFTPVPGGVGPLAVACLFENAVTLAENAINK
ncbi:MAG: tetrahydrofolate dehydrogenase/cyclohydrolase catalytic domain-containing protein [Candidatus Paceibacteria bacterium]